MTITNTGSAAVSGWQLAWSFPAGQRISQLWNGRYIQTGPQVTVGNESWNGTIAPGGRVQFGFLGSWTGGNPPPDAFTLNGTTCATG